MSRHAGTLTLALALGAIGLGSPPVRAESPADLRVKSFPVVTPSSLAMRATRVAADDEPTGAPSSADTFGEDVEILEIDAQLRDRLRESDELGQRRSLDEKVVLQVSLGIGIDGGQPSEAPLTSGAALDETTNYARLRSYGFGDLVIGTNGLGTSSLRSYLATSYRFNNQIERNSTAIPTIYNGSFSNFVVRSAWIDIDDIFERRWLKPLYLRVGRQNKYGVAVAQFTGLTVGYKTRAIRVATYFGTRASPYAFESNLADGGGAIRGGEVTLDLQELRRIPLVLALSNMSFGDKDYFDASATVRFGRNALLRAQLRTTEGKAAQESLKLRARLTKVTTISAELDNRHANDWIYDYLFADRPTEASDPRTYLNLEPPRPRIRSAVRAGTVLLRNIDLLLSAAGALEYARDDEFAPSTFRSSYLELGAALELRLRRNLRLGAASSVRTYGRERETTINSIAPDPLPATTASTGEKNFTEGGLFLQYSLGARRFSARGELYGRRFRFRSPYVAPEDDEIDYRSGGRFSIDGWAAERVRLRLEYDLSLAAIRYAPELEGVKSLRVSAEGTF